jgi:hypothetical protein
MREPRSYDYKEYWIEVTVEFDGSFTPGRGWRWVRWTAEARIYASSESARSGQEPVHRVRWRADTEDGAMTTAASMAEAWVDGPGAR